MSLCKPASRDTFLNIKKVQFTIFSFKSAKHWSQVRRTHLRYEQAGYATRVVRPTIVVMHYDHVKIAGVFYVKKKQNLAATLRGSRPGVQSASLIMTSLMTS